MSFRGFEKLSRSAAQPMPEEKAKAGTVNWPFQPSPLSISRAFNQKTRRSNVSLKLLHCIYFIQYLLLADHLYLSILGAAKTSVFDASSENSYIAEM